jgi:DNA polymerase III subunit delta'
MMAADLAEVTRLDKIGDWPAPEERADWLGEPAAERTLIEAYRSGRMHHGWLIGGPKGIGKATLAYRFARFAFANPDPAAADVTAAPDLSVPTGHPAFRRVANRAHPNLLALERPFNEETKRYRTELTVPEIRRTVSFFGSTSGEPGWRIAIVDPADDMNPNAANALLKVLEEPPARSLFFLICHAPGRLLPTIRSRTRRLELAPLPPEAIVTALRDRAGEGAGADLGLAARLAEGSLRRAILLVEEGGIETYRAMTALLARLPALAVADLHAFADSVTGRGADDAYHGFLDLLRDWLGRRVRREPEPAAGSTVSAVVATVPLARWAEVWEKVERSAADAEEYNLDRKQVVLSTLMTLARATRM